MDDDNVVADLDARRQAREVLDAADRVIALAERLGCGPVSEDDLMHVADVDDTDLPF